MACNSTKSVNGSFVDKTLYFSELFYIRNHLPVPEIDPDKYELELEVEGTDRKVVFSLDDLKKFPKATIIATLMCAGNRRAEMKKV